MAVAEESELAELDCCLAAGAGFTAGAIKTLTGHLEGTAGLAGLLLGHVALSQRFAHVMRYRSINAYVANSFAGWEVPHRLPIQAAPSVATNAGTSSFGMSGVNAHAIISCPAEAAARAELAPATWHRSLRCFVEVLVPLHPLLGAASKVRSLTCAPGSVCYPSLFASPPDCQHILAYLPRFLLLILQAKQQLQFRLPLSRPMLGFLWDHQVQSAPIMPGASYFEMAAAAGHALLKLADPAVALKAAAIAAPLRLPAADGAAAVVVTAEVALVSGDISIRSAPAGSLSAASKTGAKASSAVPVETLHLRGSLAAVAASAVALEHAPAATPALSADAVRAACREPKDTAAVYGGLQAAGLQYGPAFRQLRGIHQGAETAGAALGSSSAFEQKDADVSGFLLHPAMLDSCLQLGALVPKSATDGQAAQDGGAFVPAGLAVYLIHKPVPQGCQALAVARGSPQARHKAAGATYRDHTLLAISGAVLAVMDGLEAKQLHGGSRTKPTTSAASIKKKQDELLYEVAWQAAVDAAALVPVVAGAAGATTLNVPGGSLGSLAAVSSSLEVLQGAQQQTVAALQLDTVADAAPARLTGGSSASAGGSGNALWGMLRAFAQEAPAVAHGGRRSDVLAVGATSARISITVANCSTGQSADGYGRLVQGGAALHAVLLASSAVRVASGPYHLMPKPRGAFRNLVPEAVPVGTAQTGWVEVAVKAVGINFR